MQPDTELDHRCSPRKSVLRVFRCGGKVSRVAVALGLVLAMGLHGRPSHCSASPKIKGELIDVRGIDGNDDFICGYYASKGKKVDTIIQRVDGKKHIKKLFWSSRIITQKAKALSVLAQQSKSNPDSLTPKQSKKLKNQKKQLRELKKMIRLCGKVNDPVSDLNRVRFEHVEPIIEVQCMNCHKPLGWENSNEYFLSTGRVSPGEPENSPMYSFLSGTPEELAPGYMPKGSDPLPSLQIMMFSNWVRDLEPGSGGGVPTPTPDDGTGVGRALYTQYCSACHGAIDSSSKFGATAEEITLAIANVPQMRHLKLTQEQIIEIAFALSKVEPPEEGTVSVRSVGSVNEGSTGELTKAQFEISFSGTAKQAFTIGYVTSNGTALADNDYVFTAGTVDFSGTDGETKVVSIDVIGDNFPEQSEDFFLDIASRYGPVRVAQSTASAEILNDDVTPQQILPVQAGSLRLAFGFNGNYQDALGFSDGVPEGDVSISPVAQVGSGSLELDSGPDYLSFPGSMLPKSDFTVASWVWWEDQVATTSRLFEFSGAGNNYVRFTPRGGSNRCAFEIRTPSGVFALSCPTTSPFPLGRWTHVALTFNATDDVMEIYFDGQRVASRSAVTLDPTGFVFANNRIGRGQNTNTEFAGRIDEFLVFSRALTQDEIASVFAMKQSVLINSGILVSLNGTPIANGSTLSLDSLSVGEEHNLVFTVQNIGLAGLALVDTPTVTLHGRDSTQFESTLQPWPWQQLLGEDLVGMFTLRFVPTAPGEKIATLSVANSDWINGNWAIAVSGKASGSPRYEDPAEEDTTSPAAQGRFLYANSCAGCHGNISVSQKRGTTLAKLTTALGAESGVTQMRNLQLTAAEQELVVLALNTPVPSTSSKPVVEGAAVKLGSARFLSSFFETIFLPEDTGAFTADDVVIQQKINDLILGRTANGSFVTGRREVIGDRCDRLADTSGIGTDHACPFNQNGQILIGSARPAPNTIRSGLIEKTCSEVLSIDRAVDNVLGQIGRSRTSPVTVDEVQAVWEVFLPGKEIPTYLATVIANFPNGLEEMSLFEQHRFMQHLICSTAAWEVI